MIFLQWHDDKNGAKETLQDALGKVNRERKYRRRGKDGLFRQLHFVIVFFPPIAPPLPIDLEPNGHCAFAVPYQPVHGKYNLISVRFNKIERHICLGV